MNLYKYHKKNFTKVCSVSTIYSLLIYLLINSEEDIKENTFFFFAKSIDKSIRQRFHNHQYIDFSEYFRKYGWLGALIYSIKFHYLAPYRWPFIKTAEIYGHDHTLETASILMNNQTVIVLEDGAANYELNRLPTTYKTLKRWIVGKFVTKEHFGYSNQVQKVILTGLKPIPEEIQDKVQIIDIFELWTKSSEQKKKLILDYYSVTDSDIENLKSKSAILLTQPLSSGARAVVSDQQLISIYRDIINGIGRENLVIKLHPRDTIDYQSIFPDVLIFDKPIPFEIFVMLGVRFNDAHTINSTAVYSLPKPVEIHMHDIQPSNSTKN